MTNPEPISPTDSGLNSQRLHIPTQEGELALITGASGGIGLELARLFAADGVDLLLVARDVLKLSKVQQELQSKYQVRVIVLPVDLAEESAAQILYESTIEQKMNIDYLVNNAGFGDYGFFNQTSWDKERRMIQLNIITLTELCKVFVKPMMMRGKGKILNVASTAGFQPGPAMAVYYATKAYVLSFSQAIANELKGYNVSVTTLCPGPTKSGFQKQAAMETSKLVQDKKLPSAAEVALHGYKALKKGRGVAVHGFKNRLGVFFVRFLPRAWVTSMVRKIQSPD